MVRVWISMYCMCEEKTSTGKRYQDQSILPRQKNLLRKQLLASEIKEERTLIYIVKYYI